MSSFSSGSDPLPKKTSFFQGLLSRFSSVPASKDVVKSPAPAAQGAGQTAEPRVFTKLPILNKIPPPWRLPLLISLAMLGVTCIVLAAVLGTVLSKHPDGEKSGEKSSPSNGTQHPPGFKPLLPPSYPLAVRNPYLSAWIPGEAALRLPSQRAEFWGGQKLGWTVMAHVGNETYSLFGMENRPDGVKAANVTGAEYTSTRSDFYLDAGDANFTLSFLSPVFPGADDDSLRQQSLPLSFLTVTAEPRRGEPNIKVYSDIGHEWLGTFKVPRFNLEKTSAGNTHMWTWDRGPDTDMLREKDNMAQWGQVFYASSVKEGIGMTMSFGKRDEIRSNFVKSKALGALSAGVPQMSDSGVPVTGFAHDLGNVTKASQVVFGVGSTRDKAIRFYGSDHTHYYRAKYPKREQLIDAVADAFSELGATRTACTTLDNKVRNESVDIGGDNYADITTLSLRQVFGAMDITIPADTRDTTKTNAWMKEISSNGDIQTLDIILPASPLFYWLSPEYIRLMIRPIAIYLEIGHWPHEWAVHDLGDRAFEDGGYPRAAGHDNGRSEAMPLESTGNLLILAYMYFKSTPDRAAATAFAAAHKPLFTKHAHYLLHHGTDPAEQLSTNDGAGPLAQQTNLAIKAAVGLNAFATMYNETALATAARNMSSTIASTTHGMAADGSHLTLRYGDAHSWSTMFNLYPDVLLSLDTFTPHVLATQSAYYTHLHTAALERRASSSGPGARGRIAGLSIDSRGNYGSSNWMAFAGATDAGGARGAVGRMFVDDIHAYLANRRNRVPFCDRFFVSGPHAGLASPGKASFRARPVVGGHFAFLARGK